MGKPDRNDGGVKSSRGPKKPYKAPRLREYGDLRKITMSGKSSNRGDGGGAPATKR